MPDAPGIDARRVRSLHRVLQRLHVATEGGRLLRCVCASPSKHMTGSNDTGTKLHGSCFQLQGQEDNRAKAADALGQGGFVYEDGLQRAQRLRGP